MKSKMKNFIITGANGSIGKVVAKKLASHGHNLTLLSRKLKPLQQFQEELQRQYSGHFTIGTIDFDDKHTIKTALSDTPNIIDGLVLIPPRIKATADPLPDSQSWQDTFQRVFIHPLILIKELIPHLSQSERSKVVLLSGISSVQVLSHYALNNAIRAAWLAQVKTLAFAYGPQKIHFNTVSLGGAMTTTYEKRLQKKAQDNRIQISEQIEKEVSNVPLRKYASLEEICEVILGLLGNFSDHLTGSNILLDGGFTKAY